MLKLPKSVYLKQSSEIDTNSRILTRKVAHKSLASESISTQQMEFNDFLDGVKSIPATEAISSSGSSLGYGLREFGTASTKYVGQANIKSEEGEFIWYSDPNGDISRDKFSSSLQPRVNGKAQTLLSPPFVAGFSIGIPCEWSLELLTRDNEPSVSENYIGLGLRLNKFLRQTGASPRHVAVYYQVAHLSGVSGTGQCILRKESAIRTFGPDDLAFGWTEFIPRNALVPDSNGKFIFAAYLTMYEMTIPEAYDKPSSDNPIPTKRRRTDEESVYSQNGHFSDDADLEISCRGEKFRAILKFLTDQSDYFRKIAAEIGIEKEKGEEGEFNISPKMPKIEIDFVDPSTLEVVLDFCRTKHVRSLQDYASALALLQAAVKLGISGLDKLCVVEILCLLTPENFPAIVYNLWYSKANLNQSEKDVLANFFETHLERITKREEFKNYYRQHPLLFFDLLL